MKSFAVLLHFLAELKYLSKYEFTYILPLYFVIFLEQGFQWKRWFDGCKLWMLWYNKHRSIEVEQICISNTWHINSEIIEDVIFEDIVNYL